MNQTQKPIRQLFISLSLILFLLNACQQPAPKLGDSDWPQYKKDNFRSAKIGTNFDAATAGKAWVYEASQEPSPAWYGPAKEDAYAVSGPLPSMRDYDLAYYPIIVGSKVYYGSSSDDAVHCINADNGKEEWLFTTDGPIRMAPTFYNGHLYFGSDDGYIYCIHAGSGKLKWKFSPTADKEKKVLNNGRFISFWPIRTGILIEDGIAYFGASLLPWKPSFMCAVNIENGKTNIAGTYVKELKDMTMEGAMASTGSMLIQPQGRISPAFIRKSSGEKAGQLAGTGGCFVLVTPDQRIVHGHSSRHKSIVESGVEKEPEFMTYQDGKEMLVKGDTSYVLNDHSIAAYDRNSKKLLWLRRNYQAHRIIMAGDMVIAGGTDKIYAINIKNGLPLWEADVEGTVYALSAANNAVYASTNKGNIYAFKSGLTEDNLLTQNLDREAVIEEVPKQKKKEIGEKERFLWVKSGPFVNAVSKDSVLLWFETYEKLPVNLNWDTQGSKMEIKDSEPLYKHRFVLPVRKDFSYQYTVTAPGGKTASYQYDNFFNYIPKPHQKTDFPSGSPQMASKVSSFLKKHNPGKGFCLVIGAGFEEVAFEIAAQSKLNVIALNESANEINAFRKKLQGKKVYGNKISGLEVQEVNHLPVNSELADLVWVENGSKINADEVIRLIAPKQKAYVSGVQDAEKWMKGSWLNWQVSVEKDGDALILTKAPIENTGSWTHQYARADNSSFGGESLWGSVSTEDFEIQWMGRPGPRFQTDRSGRKPSPLAVSGKLFVQGNERVIAVNVYNGTVLWSKDFSGMLRMNVARDCSNWAAGKNHLYLVNQKNLLRVDQRNGDVVNTIPANNFSNEEVDWGYIAVFDKHLIGTATSPGASFTNYYGGAGWYDAKSGYLASKILSKNIFSCSKDGTHSYWNFKPEGAIINPTITIYNDQVAFVETRSASSESIETGRGEKEIFKKTYLVSLDKNSGEKLWEQRIQLKDGLTTYYMAAGAGKYVVVSSQERVYDIQAFSTENGQLSWKQLRDWFHSDHGAHMSKPAVVGNRLMVKPYLFNMDTGEAMDYNVPKAGHGCAHYALTEQSVFYRGGSVTQFNFDTRNFSKWERLRPDCWLSTIPAEGMILSPEAGGGCSCGNWLETSMVMAPISRAPITISSIDSISTLDFKEETWGKYTPVANIYEFVDNVNIDLSLKPGIKGPVYYTIDGSNPDKNSQVYTQPFKIDKTTEIKAVVYIEKAGKERRYLRTQTFAKVANKNKI